MRTEKEIQNQIDGLERERLNLPAVSLFGTPNHEIINAKIAILNGGDLEDFEEGDWDEMDATNEIYRGAEEAVEWMEEERDEDLFED